MSSLHIMFSSLFSDVFFFFFLFHHHPYRFSFTLHICICSIIWSEGQLTAQQLFMISVKRQLFPFFQAIILVVFYLVFFFFRKLLPTGTPWSDREKNNTRIWIRDGIVLGGSIARSEKIGFFWGHSGLTTCLSELESNWFLCSRSPANLCHFSLVMGT